MGRGEVKRLRNQLAASVLHVHLHRGCFWPKCYRLVRVYVDPEVGLFIVFHKSDSKQQIFIQHFVNQCSPQMFVGVIADKKTG
jgi:hypothetical protein